MLGPDTGWVRNVRAAGGKAALRRQGREAPLPAEIPPADQAEILPGARPHLVLGPAAFLPEFRRMAP